MAQPLHSRPLFLQLGEDVPRLPSGFFAVVTDRLILYLTSFLGAEKKGAKIILRSRRKARLNSSRGGELRLPPRETF